MKRVTLLAGFFLLFSTNIYAELKGDQDEHVSLDQIIVIGNKIERTMLETRESIEVVTDQQLIDRNNYDLTDVYNQNANVYSSFNGENFGIRGVVEGGSGGGDGEVLSYYIDDVAFTGFGKRFGPIDLWDVEQVEILRGPQTTNVGRNALAGAVSVSTKDPVLGEYEGSIRTKYESYDTGSLEGMANIPVMDSLAVRLAAQYYESDGYIENVTRDEDDFDESKNATLRGKMLWAPSDDLNILFTAQRAETERGNGAYLIPDGGLIEDRFSFSNLDDKEDYDADSGAFEINYDLNAVWRLTAITSYQRGLYERLDDDDLTADGGLSSNRRTVNERNWAQELRFNYTGESLESSIGLYVTQVKSKNETKGLVNLPAAEVGVPAVVLPYYPDEFELLVDSPANSKTENQALFAEMDYFLNDAITLNIGGRFEYEDQKNNGSTSNTLGDSTPLPDPATAPASLQGVVQAVNNALSSNLGTKTYDRETDYSAFIPQMGITYEVNPDLLVSAFVKQGYRAGGVTTTLSGVQSEFDPEELTNYELALRSVFLDGKVTLMTNIYYGDWEDQQVTVSLDGTNINVVTKNAGSSTLYGMEVSLNLKTDNGLSGYIHLGSSRTKFNKFKTFNGDFSGNEFAFSPDFNAAIGVNKKWASGIFSAVNANYQDSAYADVRNVRKLDGYTLLNTQVGYEKNSYRLAVYGKNLTDELYRTSNFLRKDQPGVQVGPPRIYGIQLTKNF